MDRTKTRTEKKQPIPRSTRQEKWKPVVGFEQYYLVSSLGHIYSIKKQLFKKPWISKKGYCEVALWKPEGRKVFKVHRLVAIAFRPNPSGKPQVNHRNTVKTDNRLRNLEWNTGRENLDHALRMGRFKRRNLRHAA
jgi:NUMOD4 motif/HNH endonuclease